MPKKAVVYDPLKPSVYKAARQKPYPEVATIPLRVKSRPQWTIMSLSKNWSVQEEQYAYGQPSLDKEKHILSIPTGTSPDELLARNIQLTRLRFGHYPVSEALRATKKYGVPLLLFTAMDTHRTLWMARSRKLDLSTLKMPDLRALKAKENNALEKVALAVGFYGLPQGNGLKLPLPIADAIEDAIAFLWSGEDMHTGPKPDKVEVATRRLWDKIKPPPLPKKPDAPKKDAKGDAEKASGYTPGPMWGTSLQSIAKENMDKMLATWAKSLLTAKNLDSKKRAAQALKELEAEYKRRDSLEEAKKPSTPPPVGESVMDVGMMTKEAGRNPEVAGVLEGLLRATGGMSAMEQGQKIVEAVLSPTPFIPRFFVPSMEEMLMSTLPVMPDGHWSELRVLETSRTISCARVDEGRNRKRALDEGVIFRNPHRWAVDRAVFSMKKKGYGVSILFDISGSMHVNYRDLVKMLEEFPVSTIGMYSGASSKPRGRLWILAKDGYRLSEARMEKLMLSFPNEGGNQCDFPALKWLVRQRKPWYWVSDGGVTYEGDGLSIKASREVYEFLLANNIKQADDWRHMKAILQGERQPRAMPNVALMPGYREDAE